MERTDFIGVYPGTFSDGFCDLLVDKFERSASKSPGRAGDRVDKTLKDSWDIGISYQADWRSECEHILQLLLRNLVPYFRAHPFLLTGASRITVVGDEPGQSVTIDEEHVRNATDEQIIAMFTYLFHSGSVNLQKYEQGRGGFHHWHSEIAPTPGDPAHEKLQRVLLWMVYLNDVEEGGETSFYFQNRHLRPTRGTLVVAPAGFTHTHRGEVPRSGDKYILTSWILFKVDPR